MSGAASRRLIFEYVMAACITALFYGSAGPARGQEFKPVSKPILGRWAEQATSERSKSQWRIGQLDIVACEGGYCGIQVGEGDRCGNLILRMGKEVAWTDYQTVLGDNPHGGSGPVASFGSRRPPGRYEDFYYFFGKLASGGEKTAEATFSQRKNDEIKLVTRKDKSCTPPCKEIPVLLYEGVFSRQGEARCTSG
ncbi:hypothetical protein [Labrys neptuniae]